ncbi:MAG: PA14 domain-containing protein, partial [Bacteroidota bacterium]
LNGMLVQEELEIEGETEKAPLEFLVSQGSVAFRNIGYKLYADQLPHLENLSYAYYEIEGRTTATDSIPDFSSLEVKDEGETDSLTTLVTKERRNFALTFEGKLYVPTSGKYLFELRVQGGAILYLDGKEVVNHDGETNYEEGSKLEAVELTEGAHDFLLAYRKEHMQWRFGMGLFVEGPGIEKMPLHSQGSVYAARKPKPYPLDATAGISLHRSYLMHEGEKLTHAISVGDSEGVHYSYDLDNASFLQMWGGDFLDVRQMWVGRGAAQIAVPMGATISHNGQPNLAILPNSTTSWPAKLGEDSPIKFKGYDIDEGGEPVFRYTAGKGEIKDQLKRGASGRSLERTIRADGEISNKAYVLLAKGEHIHQREDGMYGLDDFNYYLDLGDAKAQIRQTTHGQELLMPLSPNSSITYTLTW